MAQEDDDQFDHFVSGALRAISRYAEQKNVALAKKVRHDLRRYKPSWIYGDDHGHRHLWDEYRFEVAHGPTPQFEQAWEATIQPYVIHRISAIPEVEAVLLTISAQWDQDDLEDQDGSTRSDELISQGIWRALHLLADEFPR